MGRGRDEIISTFDLIIANIGDGFMWSIVLLALHKFSIMKTKQKTLNLVIFIMLSVYPFLTGF